MLPAPRLRPRPCSRASGRPPPRGASGALRTRPQPPLLQSQASLFTSYSGDHAYQADDDQDGNARRIKAVPADVAIDDVGDKVKATADDVAAEDHHDTVGPAEGQEHRCPDADLECSYVMQEVLVVREGDERRERLGSEKPPHTGDERNQPTEEHRGGHAGCEVRAR